MENVDKNNLPDAKKVEQKKTKLGLIIGLSVGAFVLLAVGISVALILAFNISKNDWQNSENNLSRLNSFIEKANANIESDVLDMTDSPTQENVAKVTNDIKEYREDLKGQISDLSNEKAVKQDKKAAEKFAKLNIIYKKYDNELAKLSVIYAKVLPLFVEMKDLGSQESSITSFDQVKNMADKFIAIGDKFNSTKTGYSDVDDAVAKIGADMKKIGDKMGKLSAGDLSGISDLTDSTNSLQDDSEDLRTVIDGSAVSDLEIDLSDAMYDLRTYISAQVK